MALSISSGPTLLSFIPQGEGSATQSWGIWSVSPSETIVLGLGQRAWHSPKSLAGTTLNDRHFYSVLLNPSGSTLLSLLRSGDPWLHPT